MARLISGYDIHLVGDDDAGDWPVARIEDPVAICIAEDDAVNGALGMDRGRNEREQRGAGNEGLHAQSRIPVESLRQNCWLPT